MVVENGQIIDAPELLEMSNIRQVYEANGFDSTATTSSTDEQSFELDAQAASLDSNFAVVTITGECAKTAGTSGNNSQVELKAQIKETGQSYADILAYTTVWRGAGHTAASGNGLTFRIVAALTAGMKANGFQIKVFSQSSSGAGVTTTFDNVQTIQEVRT